MYHKIPRRRIGSLHLCGKAANIRHIPRGVEALGKARSRSPTITFPILPLARVSEHHTAHKPPVHPGTSGRAVHFPVRDAFN